MRLRLSLAVLAAICFASAVQAHHSFAGTYRQGDFVRLEGTIVQFNIRNPHSNINFEVVDEKGNKVLWGGEWGSVTQLSQGGIDRFTLKAGDRVTIEGSPARDSTDHRVLVRSVRRPATDDSPEFVWQGGFQ